MTRRTVRPMPEREDLPPEIAAMGLPEEGEDETHLTVILNSNEKSPGATYHEFRPSILIPALLGWAAERPARMLRDHEIATAVTATALATTAVVSGAHLALDSNSKPAAQPPPAATAIITIAPPEASPARTPTRTARPSATQPVPRQSTDQPPMRPEAGPGVTRQPPGVDVHQREPSPRRSGAPRRTPSRTSTPPEQVASASQESRETPARPFRTSTEPEAPPATNPPVTTSQPTPQPSPDTPTTTAANNNDCLLHVDVDPLLDLCVLS